MTSESNVYQINAGIPVIATTKTSYLPSNILLQPIESHFIVKKKKKKKNICSASLHLWSMIEYKCCKKKFTKNLGLTLNRLSLHSKGGRGGRERRVGLVKLLETSHY